MSSHHASSGMSSAWPPETDSLGPQGKAASERSLFSDCKANTGWAHVLILVLYFGHHFSQNLSVLSGAFKNLPFFQSYIILCSAVAAKTTCSRWHETIILVYIEQAWHWSISMISHSAERFSLSPSKQQTRFLSAGFMILNNYRSGKKLWRASYVPVRSGREQDGERRDCLRYKLVIWFLNP